MRSRVALVLILGFFSCSCSSDDDSSDGVTNSGGSASGGSGTTGGSGTGAASGTTGGASSGGSGTETGGSSGSGTGGSQSGSGCGMDAPSGVQERSIDVGGVERTYVLSVPDGYDPEQPYPLVFAWHGLGGDGALARLYFGVEAESQGAAIFVYPDGLRNTDGDTAWDLAPDGVDVALFDELLTSLSAEYCVDANRIFATGHSYGGYMTHRLACSRGDVLRAIGSVAGGPPFGGGSNAECVGNVDALLVHGTFDPTVDVSQGIIVRDRFLEANGCGATTEPASPSPCVTYDGCTEGSVSWCEHDTPEAQAHNWPSFAAEGIWQLFAQ